MDVDKTVDLQPEEVIKEELSPPGASSNSSTPKPLIGTLFYLSRLLNIDFFLLDEQVSPIKNVPVEPITKSKFVHLSFPTSC